VVGHEYSGAARALLPKATLAAPIRAYVIEIRVRGNGDGIAAATEATETSFTLPIVAGTNEVAIDRNFDRHACTF